MEFWELRELHRVWARCVEGAGGGKVLLNGVNIFAVKDVGKGLTEAVGYPFKAQELATLPVPVLREILRALHRKHLMQSCRPWSSKARSLEAIAEKQAELMAVSEGTVRATLRELMGVRNDNRHRLYPYACEVTAQLGVNPETLWLASHLAHRLKL